MKWISYFLFFLSLASCRPGAVEPASDTLGRTASPEIVKPEGEPTAFPHKIIYTRHARCRMDCRHVTEDEVIEILREENINPRKSRTNDKPCPTYAFEGYSHEHQHLRIVVAECEEVWKIVTCIDLDEDYACSCP